MTLVTKCQESSYLDEKFSILLEWCKPSQVRDIFSFSCYKQESSFILPSPSPPYPHSVHHQLLSGWPSQHIPNLFPSLRFLFCHSQSSQSHLLLRLLVTELPAYPQSLIFYFQKFFTAIMIIVGHFTFSNYSWPFPVKDYVYFLAPLFRLCRMSCFAYQNASESVVCHL